MGAHRLIINEEAIRKDYQSARNQDGVHDIKYCAMYQLTRLTRDRGALAHDDRLDALAIAVAYFVESMEKDALRGVDELTADWLEEQLNDDRISDSLQRYVVLHGDMEILIGDDPWENSGGNLFGW